MKIKQFDKLNCGAVSSDIEKALKSVAIKYGINIRTGNGKFTKDTFDLKLNIARVVSGKVISKEVNDFKKLASIYGLKASDLGRTFSTAGREFRITGLNTKAHKYPIMAECIKSGGSYKFPVKNVKLLLDK